jgi:hypothetical protein
MAPDVGVGKLLLEVLQVLPSSKRNRQIRPLNKALSDRMHTLGDGAMLNDVLWNTP